VSESRARIGSVLCLELRTQRREPLTVLYVLVLALLAAAFAAAGPVELVRNRGAVPRDAAWSMLMATTALTAFGQLITTMVAATVVLRDEADRVSDLLITTHLTRREYLTGKLGAALIMLAVIYAAIPVGLIAGAAVAGGSVTSAARAAIPPFVLLVLPTMLAVGALQFAAGVLSGRLWVLVGLGLVLIWLWSACVDAARSPLYGALAGVLDPFGSAAALRATASWSDAERASRAMPITRTLLAGRAFWLVLGGVTVTWSCVRAGGMRPRVATVSAREREAPERSAPHAAVLDVLHRAAAPVPWRSVIEMARYVARWMMRDAGWRILTLLGALNVSIHAAIDGVGGSATHAALNALHVHARLFLILLATIYAGELVWRERDERSAALFDALPVSNLAVVTGRVLGAVAAQCIVVSVLTVAAAIGAISGARSGVDVSSVLESVLGTVLAPFVVWMLLALAVHTLVQQKVAAHLLCISAWVVAVLWSRAAAMPANGDQLGRWWLLWAPLCVVVSWHAWARGETRARARFTRFVQRRAEML
jgi:ABC-2 type transport system permease protein